MSRNQKDWDEYLPYLLFAYREVPQETTGFSPFDLLYGRQVRGPLDVLREGWTDHQATSTPVATYVVEMRQRLAEMTQLVVDHTAKSQQRQKQQYDKGTKQRCFEVGDQRYSNQLPRIDSSSNGLGHTKLDERWVVLTMKLKLQVGDERERFTM